MLPMDAIAQPFIERDYRTPFYDKAMIAELFRGAGVVPVMAFTSIEGVELEIQAELYGEFERSADGFVIRKGARHDPERIPDAVP